MQPLIPYVRLARELENLSSNKMGGNGRYIVDATLAILFSFCLHFKPSEPYLTKYLVRVKGFSHDDVNNKVYPVYTYTSTILVIFVACIKVYSFLSGWCPRVLSDKALILIGCAGRLATRYLLLFAETLFAMQIMQATYSMGVVAEVVFYAYVLKLAPPSPYQQQESQKLASLAQAASLISHTSAGLMGDWLLPRVGLRGLMWISAIAVTSASCVALFFRTVKADDHPVRIPNAGAVLSVALSARLYWSSALWWIISYSVYIIVYGYEASLYDEYLDKDDSVGDCNGTIFAVGLLAGACTAALLSSRRVSSVFSSSLALVACFVLLGFVLGLCAAVMGCAAKSLWAVAASFSGFFMAWGFANALFLGETRRVADSVVKHQIVESQLHASGGAGSVADVRDSLASQFITLACVLFNAIANIAQSLLTAVFFTWQSTPIDTIFQYLSVLQLITAGGLLLVGVACCRQLRDESSAAGLIRPEFADGDYPNPVEGVQLRS
eukprot:TRINITY_DN5725_c0_g2_i1.p1 TRINITY_DN5725_c0_g2~~TRINITY_DN5725_c0_g2_i1.p1  ORF type:complete len:496 (-),score=88.74 TRINITY_DN5725_c0_g2_i1:55-1542(-)